MREQGSKRIAAELLVQWQAVTRDAAVLVPFPELLDWTLSVALPCLDLPVLGVLK